MTWPYRQKILKEYALINYAFDFKSKIDGSD